MGLKDLFEITTLLEISGNPNPIASMRKYAEDINTNQPSKPLLIYGPSGVGKSSAAIALAHDYKWNVVNLDASDYRDSDTIKESLMPAAVTRNLFGKRNLILLDEIDDLVARFDSGASAAITELIKKSKNPIILIANNFWDKKISFLRTQVHPLEFTHLDYDEVSLHLSKLASKHSLNVDKETIKTIAARSKGDMRSAINDFYVFIDGNIKPEQVLDMVGMRDRKSDIFSVLDRIFMSNTLASPIAAMANSDVDADMLYGWLEENIPKRYKGLAELNDAFENLAYASIYSSRAVRLQYYGMWRYRNVLMSSGIALSKTGYPSTKERYAFPKIISILSQSKGSRESMHMLAEVLKDKIHANSRTIINQYLPILARMAKQLAKKDEDELYIYFQKTYGFDKKQTDVLVDLAPI